MYTYFMLQVSDGVIAPSAVFQNTFHLKWPLLFLEMTFSITAFLPLKISTRFIIYYYRPLATDFDGLILSGE